MLVYTLALPFERNVLKDDHISLGKGLVEKKADNPRTDRVVPVSNNNNLVFRIAEHAASPFLFRLPHNIALGGVLRGRAVVPYEVRSGTPLGREILPKNAALWREQVN
jgi:hypothetical protein